MPRHAPTRLIATLVLAGACGSSACSSDDRDRDRDAFRVTSPGTGAPSSGDLAAMFPGARRELAGLSSVIGYRELAGRTVVRFATTDDLRFFRTTADGFFYDGNARAGQFAHPLLLLPAAVRDGMKWEVLGTQGDVLADFEVSARGAQPTIFGELPVWHVVQRNKITGSRFETDYAEGRGPVSGDSGSLQTAVLPLEARPPKKHRARVPLTKIGDGQPIAKQFWGQRVSIVRSPTGPASLRVDGQYTWYQNTMGSGSYVLSPAAVCATVDGEVVKTTRHEEVDRPLSPPCPRATHALLRDGAAMTFTDERGLVRGPFVDAAGVRAIGPTRESELDTRWARGEPGRPDGEWAYAGAVDLPFRDSESFRMADILVSATKVDDAVGFVAQYADRLLHGRSDKAGISPLRFVAAVPGAALSSSLDVSGRRFFYTATDGAVDELTITDDGATLARVADLALPDGHELVGVAPSSDTDRAQVYVLTLRGREDFRGGVREPPIGDLYVWRATLPAPVPDPDAFEGPADQHAVLAVATGADVKVCWTVGRGDLTGWTLGGAPATAVHANADGNCVVVIRDRTKPFDPAAHDAWLVEGPIPGLGRALIAQLPDRAKNQRTAPEGQFVVATLADGTFITRSLRYGPAGTPIGTVTNPQQLPAVSYGDPVADAGGLGIWWSHVSAVTYDCSLPAGTRCQTVRRWAGNGFFETVAPAGRLVSPLAGGGMLWRADDGMGNVIGGLLRGDGSYEALPKLRDYGGYTDYRGGRSDGLACGRFSSSSGTEDEVFCRDPGGALRRRPATKDALEVAAFESTWSPADGGFYGCSRDGVLWFFDPATLAFKMIDAGGYTPESPILAKPSWSTKGELFFLLHWDGQLRGIVQIGGGKATPVPLPAGWVGKVVQDPSLLVSEKLLTVLTTSSGPQSVLRILR